MARPSPGPVCPWTSTERFTERLPQADASTMKLLLVLGLCAAAALAADVKMGAKEAADKGDKLVKVADAVKPAKKSVDKKDDEEVPAANNDIVKLPGSDKTWAETVLGAAPTALVFSANLPTYSEKSKLMVKPEVANAFNLQMELDHWNKTGNPDHLTFSGDDGKPNYALVSFAAQPVIFVGYEEDIVFHLYTKAGKDDIQGEVITDIHHLPASFNPKLPVKFIIHGFTNTIKSPVIQNLKNAFLETGEYNVIGMDWGKLCPAPWYQTARAHVSGAGVRAAELLDAMLAENITDVSKLHIIGHSLGAHVAGIAGKSMMRGKPARISGLDPAGPLFELTNKHGILWKTDADLVDVIHTNAGFLGLGKSKHLGDIDFYPNGGRLQPGCLNDWTGSCSHGRVYDLYEFTIRNPDVAIEGYSCKTLPGNAGECEEHIKRGHQADKALMGYHLKFEKPGTYYVKTTDKPDWRYLWPKLKQEESS